MNAQPEQTTVFTALEGIRRAFESHTALREDLEAARRQAHELEGDANFYKARLEEVTKERDDLLIRTTQLCERVAILAQVVEPARKLAQEFASELSVRGLDRESKLDPPPIGKASGSAALLPEVSQT